MSPLPGSGIFTIVPIVRPRGGQCCCIPTIHFLGVLLVLLSVILNQCLVYRLESNRNNPYCTIQKILCTFNIHCCDELHLFFWFIFNIFARDFEDIEKIMMQKKGGSRFGTNWYSWSITFTYGTYEVQYWSGLFIREIILLGTTRSSSNY